MIESWSWYLKKAANNLFHHYIFQLDIWTERRALVQKYCQKNFPLTNTEANLEYLVQVNKLNFDFCMVPKVASSSLSKLLLPFLPNEPYAETWPDIHHEIFRRGGNLNNSSYKPSDTIFLVTRHPLDRLVSAYKDKLENRTKNNYNKLLYSTISIAIIK